ncbi:MAG: DNA-3-methyladenine glycosylase I [Nitrososphaerota archaeon]|nr:DNA-3-methyladenine glycosylase I [Nitrososphaerota archaeon]
MSEGLICCDWSLGDPIHLKYHDEEWGRPQHDDSTLFELLILEGMQAGLSWITILKKRENFRKAFDFFDAEKISKYNENKVSDLMANDGIIRNRLKIRAAINNANAFLKVKQEYGSFNSYIWRFVGGIPKKNRWSESIELPAKSQESDTMSTALRSKGFKFVGSTICYSFMQASGMVNDHLTKCFLYRES